MSKSKKVKGVKVYTRAQANRAISNGEDPEQFKAHPNYHIRKRVWLKMGSPLPEGKEDQEKFLKAIHAFKEPQSIIEIT